MLSSQFKDNWLCKTKYAEILKLSIPLILSSAGLVFMQFVDTVFIAQYSSEAVAATGMSGMLSWMICSLFVGLIGYTGTITANNVGAGQEEKIGSTIWQGIYLALICGAITFVGAFFVPYLIKLMGHDPAIQQNESEYLQILMFGNFAFFTQCTLSGFFSGRGDNVRLMLAQLAGQLLNVALDYAFIFGKWGFPEWGVAGAAYATILSGAISPVIMAVMFFQKSHRLRYHTTAWRFHLPYIMQLLRFGTPRGLQMFIDALLWSIFLLVIGHIGTVELAASSIAFRINSLAFMPVCGLAQAMGTLVGQRHGAKDFKGVIQFMCHGLVIGQSWIMTIALTYVLIPSFYFYLLSSDSTHGEIDSKQILDTGRILLRFVALYCLCDAINITLCTGLQSVGDTKWTSKIMTVISFSLMGVLIIGDIYHWGLYTIWSIATAFIMSLPPIWIFRIRGGKWKSIRVATQ